MPIFEKNLKKSNFGKISKPGDNKLEVMSYGSKCSIGLCERMCGGLGYKISQDSGPYLVTFKEYDDKKQPNKLYFQVDGEFLQATHPRYMKVGLAPDIPGGKVWTFVKSKKK